MKNLVSFISLLAIECGCGSQAKNRESKNIDTPLQKEENVTPVSSPNETDTREADQSSEFLSFTKDDFTGDLNDVRSTELTFPSFGLTFIRNEKQYDRYVYRTTGIKLDPLKTKEETFQILQDYIRFVDLFKARYLQGQFYYVDGESKKLVVVGMIHDRAEAESFVEKQKEVQILIKSVQEGFYDSKFN